jgi:hypothetical protein
MRLSVKMRPPGLVTKIIDSSSNQLNKAIALALS